MRKGKGQRLKEKEGEWRMRERGERKKERKGGKG